MNILAVDTAGKTAGVALLQDDRLLYECYLDAGMTHSETIMPLIDNCLKFCHLTCADIDVYGVNAGPGSFTGLRIGLAVALVAKQMARHGETVLPEALLPDYHRLSQAERERAERLAAEAEASKTKEAKK